MFAALNHRRLRFLPSAQAPPASSSAVLEHPVRMTPHPVDMRLAGADERMQSHHRQLQAAHTRAVGEGLNDLTARTSRGNPSMRNAALYIYSMK